MRTPPRRARICFEEPTGVGLVLETDDRIIRIAQDDHIACRLALSPAIGPEVEGVV